MRVVTGTDRNVWLPYWEWREFFIVGDEWPTVVGEKWERNSLGETRWTGESRTYHPAPTPYLSQESARIDP